DLYGVAREIYGSHESHAHLVDQLVQHFLGRGTTSADSRWVSALDRGATMEQVIIGIVVTPEFRSRANTLFNDTPQGNYIRALFRLVMNREAPDSVVPTFTRELSRVGYAAMAQRFVASQEFRHNTVRTFLGLVPSPLPFLPVLYHMTTEPTAAVDYW